MNTDDDNDESQCSRNGTSSPLGNLDDALKTWVDPDTGAAFRKLARECGYSDTGHSGLLRDFIYLKVHGRTFTDIQLSEAKSKRDRLFGTGPIQALTVRGEVRS